MAGAPPGPGRRHVGGWQRRAAMLQVRPGLYLGGAGPPEAGGHHGRAHGGLGGARLPGRGPAEPLRARAGPARGRPAEPPGPVRGLRPPGARRGPRGAGALVRAPRRGRPLGGFFIWGASGRGRSINDRVPAPEDLKARRPP